MSYELGTVLLIRFPYSHQNLSKQRPAVVILDTGDDDVVVVPVTSRERKGPGDYRLRDWSEAGLLRPSWARLAKVACLEKGMIVRGMGKLSRHDRVELAAIGRRLYFFGK